MSLNILVTWTISTLRAQVRKVIIKCKKVMLFNLRVLFIKMYISYVAKLFLPTTYRVNFFIGTSNLINAFDETFFPPFNRYYYDWECVYFSVPLQPLLRKQIPWTQLCRLSIQPILDKIGITQIDYWRKKIDAKETDAKIDACSTAL